MPTQPGAVDNRHCHRTVRKTKRFCRERGLSLAASGRRPFLAGNAVPGLPAWAGASLATGTRGVNEWGRDLVFRTAHDGRRPLTAAGSAFVIFSADADKLVSSADRVSSVIPRSRQYPDTRAKKAPDPTAK